MNDTGEIILDLDELDTRALALCWGLTSSYVKDGNLLFSRLSNCFERGYAIRTGKGSNVEHLPAENVFDFEEYSLQERRNAYAHFSCLSSAFESHGKRSSAKFCNAIVSCIRMHSTRTLKPGTRKRNQIAVNYEGGGYTTVKRRLNRMGM